MIKPIAAFLGDTGQSRFVAGCHIALSSYAGNAVFEEWHAHEKSGISFLLNGTHEEDLLGKKYKRVPGDIKYIPAGEQHRCNNYELNTRKINVDFNEKFFQNVAVTEEQLIKLIPQSITTKFTLIQLGRELKDESAQADTSAELLLYALFSPVLTSTVQRYKAPPPWAERLKELLNDEWDKPFHLDELSARLGVHPVTISRYFPLYFSSTLGIYINRIKVDKALGLIKNTKLPLTAIAYNCGFADQPHFTRTFKAITGCLPKTFRNL